MIVDMTIAEVFQVYIILHNYFTVVCTIIFPYIIRKIQYNIFSKINLYLFIFIYNNVLYSLLKLIVSNQFSDFNILIVNSPRIIFNIIAGNDIKRSFKKSTRQWKWKNVYSHFNAEVKNEM